MVDEASVSAIIVNYNGLTYLEGCLSSLKKQTYANLKVILCDNASNDGSLEFLARNYPEIAIIKNKENFGFAKANNVAIDYALKQGTDYIFLLNNDTEIELDTIAKLVETAESEKSYGVVGPVVFDLKNRSVVQEAGMSIDRFGFPMQEKVSKRLIWEVFFISGCAMLLKREMLQTIGAFDDSYFMFAEDLDLCWRAQLAGYKIVVDRASRIYHASGGSMVGGVAKSARYKTDVRRIFLREKNTLRTLIKNYDKSNLLKIVPLNVALEVFESMFWFFIRKPNVGMNILGAIVWNIKSLPDTMTQRGRVQSLRKVGDQEITRHMSRSYYKLSFFKTVGVPDFVTQKQQS